MADKSGDKAHHFAAENNDIGMIEYIVLKGTYYRLLNKVKWAICFLHRGFSQGIFWPIRLLSNLFGGFIEQIRR